MEGGGNRKVVDPSPPPPIYLSSNFCKIDLLGLRIGKNKTRENQENRKDIGEEGRGADEVDRASSPEGNREKYIL